MSRELSTLLEITTGNRAIFAPFPVVCTTRATALPPKNVGHLRDICGTNRHLKMSRLKFFPLTGFLRARPVKQYWV